MLQINYKRNNFNKVPSLSCSCILIDKNLEKFIKETAKKERYGMTRYVEKQLVLNKGITTTLIFCRTPPGLGRIFSHEEQTLKVEKLGKLKKYQSNRGMEYCVSIYQGNHKGRRYKYKLIS
ncbi:Hypothetical protein CINCED_3A018145 [Cinara cedri]|uniref:Uncharacterized protein n=1 Tax=Cinara cedri TaxID=506608 RepID=A0A5E4N0C6_9HEMI|nr:Hypothetical protein CINCED_3A018145 [Cinara cedri]